MKTRNVIMIVAIVLIFLAAIAGVIYGVVTHREPGLMGACWVGDRVASYEVDGADECAALEWPRGAFPLRVGVRFDEVGHPGALEAVAGAVDRINTRLGFAALLVDPEAGCSGEHQVCIEVGVAYERGFMDDHGTARHRQVLGGAMRCEATTANTGTDELLAMVLEHELGHCLGLAHDDFGASIMRPVQTSAPMGEFPPWITDDDRALLRSRYAP